MEWDTRLGRNYPSYIVGIVLLLKREGLAETPPEDIPEGSKFLLEINFGDLTKSHIENQQYWIIALQAAITAGRRSIAAGS